MSFFQVKLLSAEARTPVRQSVDAAGYDLHALCDATVPARGKAMVDTGISIAIPQGYYARIAPRSSLAWKNSIDVGAGVIDSDYRGPVKVILFNHGDDTFVISRDDRIAQLIITPIATPEVIVVDVLSDTTRGAGGFGSTGV